MGFIYLIIIELSNPQISRITIAAENTIFYIISTVTCE